MKSWCGVPVGLWAYVAGTLVICGVIATRSTFCLTASDWASWVQAVGSILAIIAAGWGIRYQLDQANEGRRRAIIAIAAAAMARVEEAGERVQSSDPEIELASWYHCSIFDRLIGAFDSAPVHELRSGEGITAFLSMRDKLHFLRVAVERCIAGPETFPPFEEEFRRAREFCARGDMTPLEYELLYRSKLQYLVSNAFSHVSDLRASFSMITTAT
ncbi:hypothetical protein [Pandoraea sp. ISTKB]|uniref:hypothetical protein n=1 Tax=Pandoraea sp. ISTKB TaxID=1586708 RepID=UPI0008468C10|nr:hypothetical protein [Pandoraea sp. ISTKB]ODP31551.1 hypothetical protein A9762_06015 [Pandoraea sp. ISTKB]